MFNQCVEIVARAKIDLFENGVNERAELPAGGEVAVFRCLENFVQRRFVIDVFFAAFGLVFEGGGQGVRVIADDSREAENAPVVFGEALPRLELRRVARVRGLVSFKLNRREGFVEGERLPSARGRGIGVSAEDAGCGENLREVGYDWLFLFASADGDFVGMVNDAGFFRSRECDVGETGFRLCLFFDGFAGKGVVVFVGPQKRFEFSGFVFLANGDGAFRVKFQALTPKMREKNDFELKPLAFVHRHEGDGGAVCVDA